MSGGDAGAPTGIEATREINDSAAKIAQETAALKYLRVLRRLLEGPLHRFEAERYPVSDHVLNSTVSELKKRGLVIHSKLIRLPGYSGLGANVAEYTLAPESIAHAKRLLAGGG